MSRLSLQEREELSEELYQALRSARPIKPLTGRYEGLRLNEAYDISQRSLAKRVSRDGERVVGKKVGVTSEAVQKLLNVYQPDFGTLTDHMRITNGAEVIVRDQLIQPRIEGELAFVIGDELRGPGVSEADVLASTEYVVACFEIVDSRIEDWQIAIEDTVADNASCGRFVLGEQPVDPRAISLPELGFSVFKNRSKVGEGRGDAVLGNPARAVAWLANQLSEFGEGLSKGAIVLSGSATPLVPVKPGDELRLSIVGVGDCHCSFER